jgi:hypothetical protein
MPVVPLLDHARQSSVFTPSATNSRFGVLRMIALVTNGSRARSARDSSRGREPR